MTSERIQRRIERLLDQVEEAADQEDWEVVRRLAQQALDLSPDSADAKTFLDLAERRTPGPGDAAVPSPSSLPSEVTSEATVRPTSFANGRYVVKDFLGEGGKKRVYQAHDSVLDRDVALAVIKIEGLDPTSRVRITREAQAMGRLGDHPHVLSIHDLGEDNGQPYMVLPLMPGGDVGTLLEKAEDHRLPLEQAIDLAAQICRGLEFAHSKSIIHRDLKPGNVWLTSDGTAKIGDFGLAVAIDRSRLTQEGMMVGTVSYMPPEQAMGGDVTPQSDLYSLGAMLYEMVCGRPPFLGDDSVAIIGQHINTPPVAPTWHNSECPRALEALILRLLTKDPSERPESAADVLTGLEGIDLTADVGADEHDEAHALDSLAGGVFVGRQREMSELKAALEDALSGRGRLVTLVGEPGIGKTRTSEELATYARMRGAQVLWGRCYEEQGVPPYWPWVQAIRSYVRERDSDELMSEMGAGAADIAEIVSDVKAKLPGLPVPPLLDSPEQARFRLFDSVTAFLRTAGQRQLLVIVLDDLHWADQPSLMLLQFVTREIANARVLVLGTYRDMELSRQHPLAETLGDLTRERLFTRVLLRGLARSDVERFIEIASGVVPPAGLVSAVHVQTEGNPLFVTEVVRLLVQEGDLTPERAASRDSWTVRIPEGVREVIGRRLNRLSSRCNEVLTTAAVIGREFELRQLNVVTDDLTQDMLLDVLEEGLDGRVVEELPTAAGRYQFTHAMIQETLLEELSLTRRVRLHALVADKLEELYGDDAEAHAAQLANHYAQSETVRGPDKLVKYSIIAGESSLGSYANEEALQHFTRAWSAIQGGELDDTSASVLYGLGRAQAVTSDVFNADPAISNLTAAFNYYKEADLPRAALIAQIAHSVEIITGLAEVIRDALLLVPLDSVEYGRILANHGYVLGVSGDYESCQRAFADAMAIAQRTGDRSLEARVLANSGNIDGFHFRMDDCLEKCSSAIELLEPNDYSSARLRARLWAGNALIALGRPIEARRHHDDLRAASARLRDRIWTSRSTDANTLLALAIGDWEGVREGTEAVLAASEGDFWAICNSAYAAHLRGDRDELRLRLDQAGADVHSTGRGFISSLRHVRGLTTLAMIPDAEQHQSLMSAVAEWAEAGDIAARLSQYRNLARAFLTVRSGDKRRALDLFHEMLPFKGTLSPNATSADRVLGLLATVLDDEEGAAAHFEDALVFCRKAGYRPELAWTCSQYADLLLERNSEGDRERAISLLDEALATASELRMAPLVEQVLARKMSLQGIDVSSPQTSIDAVVSAVEVERPNLEPHAAPDGTVTLMFTDIEGSTAMTERLGDARAQDVLRIHNAIIREQVGANEGFEVKSQGDGFMLAFSSARTALECAIAIQQNFAIHEEAHPGEPIRIRIGLHTGEAIKEGEDFFGKTVILAARIACEAAGGQILVSSLLKALVESSGEFEFSEGREMELKGLAGTYQVFEVNLP